MVFLRSSRTHSKVTRTHVTPGFLQTLKRLYLKAAKASKLVLNVWHPRTFIQRYYLIFKVLLLYLLYPKGSCDPWKLEGANLTSQGESKGSGQHSEVELAKKFPLACFLQTKKSLSMEAKISASDTGQNDNNDNDNHHQFIISVLSQA